jgi:RNA recognition motif-containing protein
MDECESLVLYTERVSTDDRVDIVAKKNGGGREQAFVVFEEQTAATAALRGLSGQLFYKKALVRLSSSPLTLIKERTDS